MPKYVEDRYIHSLLIGKSGTGKSTLLLNWWDEDELYGNAKILIDPSGFLAGDAYSIAKKAHYLSLDNPISINPMMLPYSETQISDLIKEAINQVVTLVTPNLPLTVGMLDLIDDAIKECLRKNRKSLLHVRDYLAAMKFGRAETREGILSRLNFLLSDEKIQKIICGNKPISIGNLIDRGETLIVDCFGLSKEKMIFVGSLITLMVKSYFRNEKPKEYKPLALYIDECHNFINPNIADILKEGRRYNLSCVLATQDFAMIEEQMTRLMLNVGNIVSYRLGAREASYVAKEMDFTPQTLQFLGKYHVGYLTPKGTGIAKTPRPPIFKPNKPPKFVEPQRKSKKPSWFTLEPLESYQSSLNYNEG